MWGLRRVVPCAKSPLTRAKSPRCRAKSERLIVHIHVYAIVAAYKRYPTTDPIYKILSTNVEVLQGGKQVRPEELSEAEHRGPPSSLCALQWRRVIRMMKGSSVWRQVFA